MNEIKSINGEILKIYYPFLFSEWTVEYKRLVGHRKVDRRFLLTNLVKGETYFTDHRFDGDDLNIDHHWVLPQELEVDKALEEGKEFLRRYYIHTVRSWKVPKIQYIQSYPIFLSYTIFKKNVKNKQKLFIYEVLSKSSDELKKYGEIKNFLQTRGIY
ncbi:hypothetical protein [Aeribacillus alveayuensis]|uniref:Uncharacterized protein n=1 Tax=Aeribacillus alveayuensis TaxID=279215 RepID=A0ABT9VQB6_9BACI|nr:hypothetical protein [Bacillus alveayuensis]